MKMYKLNSKDAAFIWFVKANVLFFKRLTFSCVIIIRFEISWLLISECIILLMHYRGIIMPCNKSFDIITQSTVINKINISYLH